MILGLEADEAAELKSWMEQVSCGEKRTKKQRAAGCLKKPASQNAVPEKKAAGKKPSKPAVKIWHKAQTTYKTTFMHRATSSSWNKAKKAALKQGKSLELVSSTACREHQQDLCERCALPGELRPMLKLMMLQNGQQSILKRTLTKDIRLR